MSEMNTYFLGGSEDRSSPDKESQSNVRMSEPTVSAGMGQEALLALLEARVTDLCAQLDNIDPGLRDAIFLVSFLLLFSQCIVSSHVFTVNMNMHSIEHW